MAIKEFVIGPQNYWEDGYFSGDYTLPNVSRSYLQCDIDKILGGRVVTGEYFQDNYIDGTYWHANSITFEMAAEAMIVQQAVISASGYLPEGYYASGYYKTAGSAFVMVADVEKVQLTIEAYGNWTTTSSVSAQGGLLIDVIIQTDSLFSPQITAEVIVNPFATVEVFTYFTVNVEINRSISLALENIANINAQADRFADFSSNPSAVASISASGQATKSLDANIQVTSQLDLPESINYVNASASITGAFAPIITAQASKSGEITLSGQFSLEAQVIKQAREAIVLSAVITQSATALRIKKFASSLTTTSTLTCQGRDLDLASISITSTFALTALAREIPVDAYENSTTEALLHFETYPLVDTMRSGIPQVTRRDSLGNITTPATLPLTSGKFNSTINTNQSGYSLITSETANIQITGNFVAEFWYNYQGDISNYGYSDTLIVSIGGGAQQRITYTSATTGNTVTGNFSTNIWAYDPNYHTFGQSPPQYDWGLGYGQLYLNWASGITTRPPESQITNVTPNAGVWEHYLISRSGSTWYFFINGNLVQSWTGLAVGTDQTTTSITLGGGGSFGLYDEFRLRKGVAQTTNFTVPTQPYPEVAAFVKQLVSDQSTTATLSASALKVKLNSAGLQAQSTLAVSPKRLRNPGARTLSSAVITSITGQKNAILSSNQNAEFAVTASLSRTKRYSSSMSAEITMQVEAIKTVSANSNLSTEFAQQTNNSRLRSDTANWSTTTSTQPAVTKIARTGSTINAWVTEVSVVNKIGRGLIGLDAVTTVLVSAVVTRDVPIYLAAPADLTCDASNILYAESQLVSEITQTVKPDYLRRPEAVITATSAMTISNDRIRGFSSQQAAFSNSIVSTLFSVTRGFSSQQAAQFDLSTNNQIVRLGNADMNSAFLANIIAGSVTRYEAHLEALDFLLLAGRIIHIDDYYQLKIAGETRYFKIIPESRLLTVDQETRVNKITG